MIPLYTVFGGLVVLFAIVGSLRGWAKEIIVAFSVVLALFVEHVLLVFLPSVALLFSSLPMQNQFYVRAAVFIVIAIFGYAGPTVVSRLGARIARERLQDLLLGFFIGIINGYLIVGTLLSFLSLSYYGIPSELRLEQQKVDQAGKPVVDQSGKPEMETVYHPDAKGIGGVVPPAPNTRTDTLLQYLPPRVIEHSEAVLYIAIAAAFVFVIVVFI